MTGVASPVAPAEILEAIGGAGSILLATHSPMDGDGLGCGLALLRALGRAGKECLFVTEAPPPRAYRFLEGYGSIRLLGADEPVPDCDVLLGLDAGDGDRLGRCFSERPAGATVLNIDHHISNPLFGDRNWVDPEAGSTGELVFRLLLDLGLEIDPQGALCLLVALVTDTGRFCYSSTTARTFEIAADLVRRGADPDRLNTELYASVSMGVLRLRSRAVASLQLHAGGRVATLTVPHGYADDTGADEEDLKDLVDLAICVQGVVVAALVRELPDGSTKVSLRSKDDRADVSRVASAHGGGGHVRAAGFSDADGSEAVAARLLPELAAVAAAVGATG